MGKRKEITIGATLQQGDPPVYECSFDTGNKNYDPWTTSIRLHSNNHLMTYGIFFSYTFHINEIAGDLEEYRVNVVNPIAESIIGYQLTDKNAEELRAGNTELLRELLKDVLAPLGYVVDFPHRDFPSPTSLGHVVPTFTYGVTREKNPDIQPGYKTTVTYLSIKKPQSQTQIQLKIFGGNIDERVYEQQKLLKDTLTPYGTKCLYLCVSECAKNNRQPWFILDTNKSLDALGYTRDKRGIHGTVNRKRLLKELGNLTKIDFEIERRIQGGKNKEKAFRFTGPIISISEYKTEEWETTPGKPIEEGIHINDRIQIFVHPEIYGDIKDWYTIIPNEYLKIDVGRMQYAVQLYPYIANQWRMGATKYKGVIHQSLRRILEETGLIHSLPNRRNDQTNFFNKIKASLSSLKNQKEFWIKDVRFERTRNKLPLDKMVDIIMADDHPLKARMPKMFK